MPSTPWRKTRINVPPSLLSTDRQNDPNVEIEFDVSDAQCAEMVLNLIKTLQTIGSDEQCLERTCNSNKLIEEKRSNKKRVHFDIAEDTETESDDLDYEIGDNIDSRQERNEKTTVIANQCRGFKNSEIKLKTNKKIDNKDKLKEEKKVRIRIKENCQRMKKSKSQNFMMQEKTRQKGEKEYLKRLIEPEKEKQKVAKQSSKVKKSCELLKEKVTRKNEKEKIKKNLDKKSKTKCKIIKYKGTNFDGN